MLYVITSNVFFSPNGWNWYTGGTLFNPVDHILIGTYSHYQPPQLRSPALVVSTDRSMNIVLQFYEASGKISFCTVTVP